MLRCSAACRLHGREAAAASLAALPPEAAAACGALPWDAATFARMGNASSAAALAALVAPVLGTPRVKRQRKENTPFDYMYW